MLRTCFCYLLILLGTCAMAQSLDQVYAHLKSGSLDSAEWSLDQLPTSANKLALKGYVNSKLGYKQKAILFYNEALDNNPTSKLKYDCHKNLSLMYQKMGLYSHSKIEYQKALGELEKLKIEMEKDKWSKENFSLSFNHGLLYEISNQNDLAIEQLAISLKNATTEDQEARVLNMMGVVYKKQKDLAGAIAIYDTIIMHFTHLKYTAKAHHNRAMALKELGEDPLPDLYKALEYKTGEARFITLMDLGELTQDMNLLDSALHFYPREADPDDYKIYRIMLRLALDRGDVVAAKGYDSLYQIANEKYLSMMRESRELAQRYATANTLAQYEQQKLQKEQEAANEKRYFLIMLTLAAIALIGMGFFVYMRQRRLALARDVTDILQRPQR